MAAPSAKSSSKKARQKAPKKAPRKAPKKAAQKAPPAKRKSSAAKPRRAAPAVMPYTGVFLVKSEPFVYSFDQLLADEKTSWDGVRNYEARNAMRAMKKGDTLLYYHSNEGKEIVGVARVSKEAYQDPTTTEDWSAVEIAPVKKLTKPVTLATIKAHPLLSRMALVKKSRISVVPVMVPELEEVLKLSETAL